MAYFFLQAEDGIRDRVRSRGLGDVYKRQLWDFFDQYPEKRIRFYQFMILVTFYRFPLHGLGACLLYTSDAADDLLCVDPGGCRIIKKKKKTTNNGEPDMMARTTLMNNEMHLAEQRVY